MLLTPFIVLFTEVFLYPRKEMNEILMALYITDGAVQMFI